MTSEQMSVLWRRDRFGDLQLTDAVRPASPQAVLRQGYRRELFRDQAASLRVPVLAAAVSKPQLFDVFVELLGMLGPTADVVLETSHDSPTGGHCDLFREHIDLPVLMSHCCEFEDLLTNDGCTGLAAISTTEPIELQFDEHKMLFVYGRDLRPAEVILAAHGVRRDDRLRLVTESEHLHSTDPRHREAFDQLCCRLGVGEPVERVNW